MICYLDAFPERCYHPKEYEYLLRLLRVWDARTREMMTREIYVTQLCPNGFADEAITLGVVPGFGAVRIRWTALGR
jgi:hypothetical protein